MTKFQTPNLKQKANRKAPALLLACCYVGFGAWSFEFVCALVLGDWSFRAGWKHRRATVSLWHGVDLAVQSREIVRCARGAEGRVAGCRARRPAGFDRAQRLRQDDAAAHYRRPGTARP